MKILKYDEANEEDLAQEAADYITQGKVIAYPTDTIYGLGANALDEEAVKKVFEIKDRPLDKKVSVLVADFDMLRTYAEVNLELVQKYLPGPYTLVFRARKLPKIFLGDDNKVAFRITDNSLAQYISLKAGVPITSTSVNESGAYPLGKISKINEKFGDKIDLAIDCGELFHKPSTVIDLTGDEPVVLRK